MGAGRNMKPEQVEAIAKGRIWSGKSAKTKGLVDEIGGLHTAIARVRKEAIVNVGSIKVNHHDRRQFRIQKSLAIHHHAVATEPTR